MSTKPNTSSINDLFRIGLLGGLCLFVSYLSLKDALDNEFFFKLKWNRVVLCWVVAVALANSGYLLQKIMRNPLASPDILGINSSSAFWLVLTIFLYPSIHHKILLLIGPLAALFNYGLLSLFIFKSQFSPKKLILVGVANHIFFSSFTQIFLYLNEFDVHHALTWLMGSFYGKQLSHEIYFVFGFFIFTSFLIAFLHEKINLLNFPNAFGESLGQSMKLLRSTLLLICFLNSGLAIGFGGPIPLLSLMAPQIAWRLWGKKIIRQRTFIFHANLLAIFILLVSDYGAKNLFYPLEIPTGIFSTTISAPLLIFLYFYTQKEGFHENS